MKIVIDVGCQTHGEEESVQKLARRFAPCIVIGFDPGLAQGQEGTWVAQGCARILRRAAAWTDSRFVGFIFDGNKSGVAASCRPDAVEVPAVDLPALISALPGPLILKLDCEGCEYPLLDAIQERGLHRRLDRVLVEWHPDERSRGLYDPAVHSRILEAYGDLLEEWA